MGSARPTSRTVYRDAVQVHGLAEFQRDLRAIDKALPRELRRANRDAAEVVATAGRARAESLGGVAAKSAPSLVARGEQRYAKISLGGARYPFALGANFGATHDIVRNTPRGPVVGWNQFPEWGGNQHTGGAADRFLYWAVRAKRAEFVEAYEREIGQLVAEDRFAGRTSGSHVGRVTGAEV